MTDESKNFPNIDSVVTALGSIGFSGTSYLSLLRDGDDWSFVIKLHALLETVFTEFITMELAKNELTEIFANLEMSNSKTGKLAFAKAVGLTSKESETFIRRLSELRNELVHKITNIEYSIVEEIQNIQKTKLSKSTINCIEAASKFYKEEVNLVYPKKEFDKNLKIKLSNFFDITPRFTIWFAAFRIISTLHDSKQ